MNETYRNISLVFEIGNSIKFIKRGLGEVQKITGANDFYHPALQFLSSGFERLFKTMLCLNFKENNNKLPSYGELLKGKNGHDIEYLKSEVEKICIPVTRPFASMDYGIITNDEIINIICKTLSEYGQKSRYFNLDAVLGKEQEFDAVNAWEKIETKILKEHLGEKKFFEILQNPKLLDSLYEKSNELIVSRIELFIRAITRQFIFGNFSSDSKTFLFEIEPFIDIDDNKIGKNDYRF
ncbi:MAG: hypothetical protein JKX79_13010 [Labilibaculum sp.]|nr:hypothetical protein [Labilibaculum sp.]